MAKWIRAKPYYTMEDIAARIRDYQKSQRLQQQHGAHALAQLAQALGVALAR